MLISQESYYTLEDQPIMKFQVLYEMLGDSQILLTLCLYSFKLVTLETPPQPTPP